MIMIDIVANEQDSAVTDLRIANVIDQSQALVGLTIRFKQARVIIGRVAAAARKLALMKRDFGLRQLAHGPAWPSHLGSARRLQRCIPRKIALAAHAGSAQLFNACGIAVRKLIAPALDALGEEAALEIGGVGM